MKKRVIVFVMLVIVNLFLISLVTALSSSIEDEMKKLTYYAEEYETSNTDYVQLLVHMSEARQNLNEILGATEKQIGGVLKQEQIESILGSPTEETKWVWVEGEEHDKKLDNYVPVWKKIVFDGKKIQIRLEAFPLIFTKKKFNGGLEDKKEVREEIIREGDLIYRLHFGIEFKKPEEQLDILGKINEIKSLAEVFNSDPSQVNAEALAKESVNTEKTFESYFRQNQGKCEDLMASIFGSENQKQTQDMLVQKISFYEGENFEVVARLEMCDRCEWNWINLDLWTETRGPMPGVEEAESEKISPEQFKDKDSQYFKTEIVSLLDSYKKAVDEKNWKEANRIKQEIWMINEAWNQKSNDVWQKVDESFKSQTESMTQEQHQEFDQNYGWLKQEQEKREKEKELRKQNYEERKQFYLGLFSDYDKKEYSFVQIEFKKRLIEEFKEFGEEICDNNQDDNKNEKVDCDDEQCGGKFCGKLTVSVEEGNQTIEKTLDLYCIVGECKVREEIIKERITVCGNHICEGNETIENCAEDCSLCQEYPAINCSGKVIFKGKDKNGCPLEPVCIEEKLCSINEDCKFLCGDGECIEGKCEVKELKECKEAECVDGDKRILSCQTGEQVVVEECINGLWIRTGIECEIREENKTEENCNGYCLTQPYLMCEGNWEISGDYPDCNCNWVCQVGDIVGDECVTREDCGNKNDVCSNGRCIAIPEVIPTEPEAEQPEIEIETSEAEQSEIEQPEHPVTEEQPSEAEQPEIEQPEPVSELIQDQETPTTGGIIFAFFRTLLSRARIIGATITGSQTEEGTEPTSPPSETKQIEEQLSEEQQTLEEQPPGQTPPPEQLPSTECADRERGCGEPCPPCEEPRGEYREEYQKTEDERREKEEGGERERREEEQKERCRKDCTRPCVEKCIRENCGEELNCNVDEESKKCETSCFADDSCVEKCMKGGDWWKEFEQKDEHKEEKGVFESGGSCRTAKGRTEGFIWFGGWGDPFEQIQQLKHKYYSGGNADWCKHDLQNLIKQRREFEKGFNQEFAVWFFEKYLTNSARDWEQSVSGIFELYWNNIDNQRQIAERMKCLGINNINEIMNYNLIGMKYDTEYGSLEYWEEAKEVKIPGLEGKFIIISPYMKIWIFPPIEFIKYEMKESMKAHEFPGPPEDSMERKNEEGPTAEEKEMIKQDKKFMEKIQEISEKYNGNLDVVIQLKDDSTQEVLFNLYAQINENDLLIIEPMLPEENPSEDIKVEIPFSKIYDLIYMQEKEMKGTRTESPPWDKKIQPMQKIKEVVNGVKMYFKVRSIMNSAEFTPDSSESEMKSLFKSFFSMMGKAEKPIEELSEEEIEKMKKEGIGEEEGKEVWESKEKITGEIISK